MINYGLLRRNLRIFRELGQKIAALPLANVPSSPIYTYIGPNLAEQEVFI